MLFAGLLTAPDFQLDCSGRVEGHPIGLDRKKHSARNTHMRFLAECLTGALAHYGAVMNFLPRWI